jgi:hypothetical protein
MVDRPSPAASIWPHLPQTNVEPQAPRRNISPLAASMYPSLAPKPEPLAPRPRRMTREEIHRDFSNNMDPQYAQMVGLVKTGW